MSDDPATKSIPPSGDESTPSPEPASFQLEAGDRVGNYVIREQIGEGGFAIVYAAEQEKPVRRKVALKIIKLGMDTKQVIARFEAERQALAMMDHPNVAKVFDAGATVTGRPYFVMEYIAGEAMTGYCDRNRLTTRERLDLFVQACDAVQHAHQKGIIHRDIKPSNILVTVKEGRPLVKVIDFGVAKAISQKLSEQTVYTEQGILIGTPEYMSPEQAEMRAVDIDTRSDIYSLGVVLYELLVGALPFDQKKLRQAAYVEIQRIIREDEPPMPSTRLSGLGGEATLVSNRHRAEPKTLFRELLGDLDWITMKALEKDRSRRYATASGLADDVKRHLVGNAVEAAPPSRRYRASRSIRRHSTVLNGVCVAVLGIAVFSIVAGQLATLVIFSDDDLQTVAMAFLVFIGVGLYCAVTLAVAAMSFILWRVCRDRFSLMNMSLGATYVVLLIASVASMFHMGQSVVSELEHASGLLRDGQNAEAEAILSRHLELARIIEQDDDVVVGLMHDLARAIAGQGRLEEAADLMREEIELRSRDKGNEDPGLRHALDHLAAIRRGQGQLGEAERLLAGLWEIQRRIPGENGQSTLSRRAGILVQLERYEEAGECFQQALEISRREHGDEAESTLELLINLADLYQAAGRFDEAEPLFRESLAALRRSLASDDPRIALALVQLGWILLELNRALEAELILREGLDIRQTVLPDGDWRIYSAMSLLGASIAAQERFDEAEPLLRGGYVRMDPPTIASARKREALERVVQFYDAWGKPEKAAEWRAKLPTEQDAVASDPTADERRNTGPSRD